MGFDLIGKNTKHDKGEYFRNNVWGWRPLWMYVCEECKDILTAQDAKSGQYNDGHFISEEKATKIADRLDGLLKAGDVNKYEVSFRIHNASLPDEQCEFCNGTGVRSDKFVQGKCNGCSGSGKRRPHEASYPFAEENVKEFAEFCRHSKGFEIH